MINNCFSLHSHISHSDLMLQFSFLKLLYSLMIMIFNAKSQDDYNV